MKSSLKGNKLSFKQFVPNRSVSIGKPKAGKNLVTGMLLLLILTTSYNAQAKRTAKRSKPMPSSVKPCTLSKENKITLRGFYLGQHKEEFSFFPNFNRVYEKLAKPGVLPLSSLGLVQMLHSDLGEDTSKSPLGQEYDDVGFHLNFLDDKVMSLSVDYNSYEPSNLSEFIRQISNTTRLPYESWTIDSPLSRAIMKCSDFEVYAFRSSYKSPSILMTDLVAEAELTRRAEQAERVRMEAEKERKRIELERKRVFKP